MIGGVVTGRSAWEPKDPAKTMDRWARFALPNVGLTQRTAMRCQVIRGFLCLALLSVALPRGDTTWLGVLVIWVAGASIVSFLAKRLGGRPAYLFKLGWVSDDTEYPIKILADATVSIFGVVLLWMYLALMMRCIR